MLVQSRSRPSFQGVNSGCNLPFDVDILYDHIQVICRRVKNLTPPIEA